MSGLGQSSKQQRDRKKGRLQRSLVTVIIKDSDMRWRPSGSSQECGVSVGDTGLSPPGACQVAKAFAGCA